MRLWGQATDIKVFTCLFGRLVATYVCILSKTREEFMVYPGKFSFMDQTVIMAYLQKTISFQCFASDKENRSAPLEPIQIIGSSSSSKVMHCRACAILKFQKGIKMHDCNLFIIFQF